MRDTEIELVVYQMKSGRSPFNEWLGKIKDRRILAIIDSRLSRVRLGNFGNCRSLGGSIRELKISYGPGFRIYFSQIGGKVVLLLCSGSKKTQSSDIMRAHIYLADYFERTKN